MRKNILVTGATGFLGKELIPKITKDYSIRCLVRKTSNITELKKHSLEIVYGNILDKKKMLEITKNIDIVIHLATSHGKEKSNRDIIGSKNLIDASKKNKVKRIIFLSSMAANRRIPDSYGKVKILIENYLKKSGLKYTILRPSIIYSKNNLSIIGKSLFIIPFFIPVIGNGDYKMGPVFIGDIIKSIKKAIENKKSVNKIYEISGREQLSFNELIKISKEELKIKKKIVHIPLSVCKIIFRLIPLVSIESLNTINESSNANIEKLVQELNVNPISFREGIKNVNI